MKKLIYTGWLQLLRWLQQRCEHPAQAVRADIGEGDSPYRSIKWCEICGAFQIAIHAQAAYVLPTRAHLPNEWRAPRPDYYIEAIVKRKP